MRRVKVLNIDLRSNIFRHDECVIFSFRFRVVLRGLLMTRLRFQNWISQKCPTGSYRAMAMAGHCTLV
jgi:hypothetical protein